MASVTGDHTPRSSPLGQVTENVMESAVWPVTVKTRPEFCPSEKVTAPSARPLAMSDVPSTLRPAMLSWAFLMSPMPSPRTPVAVVSPLR